jgi:crotonobetainyl-CoA:carnitine CoA-transferase CaiB-like acyl-CoA transferase
VAPTQNIDGTPITNLAGYRIYYGTSAGALSQTIDVAGPAATTYALADLAPGTYYFVVTAYNTAGIQSAQSSMASKTI